MLRSDGVPSSALAVAFRDEPRSAPGVLPGDQPMTDHPSTVVDEEKVSNPKVGRGDELRGEAIARPQRRVHAPSRDTEANCRGAKQEIANLDEIRQLEPIAVHLGFQPKGRRQIGFTLFGIHTAGRAPPDPFALQRKSHAARALPARQGEADNPVCA